MLIKLELEVTPKQLTGIGQVLSGQVPATETVADAKPEIPATYFEAISGTIQDEEVKPGDTVIVIGATGPNAEAINGEHQITSPAADAFAADAKEAPGKPEPSAAGSMDDADGAETNTQHTTSAIDLAKGTNGQMIPWDVRIHGKAKKKNADNSWRLIQGVDRDTLVPQVEAELVAALTAPKPATDAAVAAIPAPPENATVANNAEPAASTVVTSPSNVPTPPPAADKPSTFAELLPLVTAAKAAGTLTDETIASTCQALGLAQFGLIATRPDLIPRAAELLGV